MLPLGVRALEQGGLDLEIGEGLRQRVVQFPGDHRPLLHQQQSLLLQQGLIFVQHLGQQHSEVFDQSFVDRVLTDDVEAAELLFIHL